MDTVDSTLCPVPVDSPPRRKAGTSRPGQESGSLALRDTRREPIEVSRTSPAQHCIHKIYAEKLRRQPKLRLSADSKPHVEDVTDRSIFLPPAQLNNVAPFDLGSKIHLRSIL